MIEVAVADNPELAAFFQCRIRLLEHAPRRGVVNGLLLVERGVAEDEVGTFFRCSGEPVADGERHFARAAKCRLEIGVGRGDRHKGFIDKRESSLGVARRGDQANDTIAATKIDNGALCV